MWIYILQALIAVPVFLLEILFLFWWFIKFYLPGKGMTLQRLKKRVRNFSDYRKALKKGNVKESLEMKELLKQHEKTYKYMIPILLCNCAMLYIIGLVFAVFVTVFTKAMWGEWSVGVILFMWAGMFAVAVSVFFSFWKSGKGRLIEELDQYIDFLLEFTKQMSKENGR